MESLSIVISKVYLKNLVVKFLVVQSAHMTD
jgi:hypothetical protein